MAGGTFTGYNKTRPGLYMNFVSAAQNRIATGERGTVLLPLELDWGAPDQLITIETEQDFASKLGYNMTDERVFPVKEAKKRALTVLVSRLNGDGVKASGSWGEGSTATAKHPGIRGNAIRVSVGPNIVDETSKDVRTYVDAALVDEQTISSPSDIKPNDWADFAFTALPADTAGTQLEGGTNSTVTNQSYVEFLATAEKEFFDVVGFPVNDDAAKEMFVSFIKRMRDQEGKRIVGVVPRYSADHEGIINVANAVEIDGRQLTPLEAVYWVAGASAGAQITDSNTYAVYDGATDAVPRMINSEIVAALKSGEFIFVNDGDRIKVEQDINSLVNPREKQNDRFKKNRVIRVLDAISNDFRREFSTNYIGKVDNNGDGQTNLKAGMVGYMKVFQGEGAIQNFVPDDVFIDPVNSVGDQVVAGIAVQPVDSMEKIYITVEVI
ncbi:phage tail sheath family protein [Aureibacillus halotolerans]|uniref:Tail sheath protein n=1 Tax=Aureibacillus halotolerans TaxID=1508390 RepID=A0A4R6TRH6_9BACI|nr:phage tail sheath family protein [Aureibacillus halotolerans]TDQ35282.1 tail sheath protein [Aureibacillus halotolerans]